LILKTTIVVCEINKLLCNECIFLMAPARLGNYVAGKIGNAEGLLGWSSHWKSGNHNMRRLRTNVGPNHRHEGTTQRLRPLQGPSNAVWKGQLLTHTCDKNAWVGKSDWEGSSKTNKQDGVLLPPSSPWERRPVGPRLLHHFEFSLKASRGAWTWLDKIQITSPLHSHQRARQIWSKEPPPPGGVFYLLCSLIKNCV